MKILCLLFLFGSAFAFDKNAWIAKLGDYGFYNSKNEVMVKADCDETPGAKLESKLFSEPTSTKVANAISSGQDPTPLLDGLCYLGEDPEVWKTLDTMLFGGKACGVNVRSEVFQKISDFGNQNCDPGCDNGKLQSNLEANWGKIQPFFDLLNDWLADKAISGVTCHEVAVDGIIAVRDAVKGGGCKAVALKKFLDYGYGLFTEDELGVKDNAYVICRNFRMYKEEQSKAYYRSWPQDAAGISKVILNNMLRVGS